LSITQVEVMNKTDRTGKADTAFKLFDKNKDGFITREEFTQVTITRVHLWSALCRSPRS
jgi:Ca2+-binding EF-hand superfamily protein